MILILFILSEGKTIIHFLLDVDFGEYGWILNIDLGNHGSSFQLLVGVSK